MLPVGFNNMFSVFEWEKTFLALDLAPLRSDFGMISFRITNSMATKLKHIKLSHSALCVVAVLINEQQKHRVLVHGIQKISGNMLFHFLHISDNLKNVQLELWQKLRHDEEYSDELRRIQNEAITLHLP